MPQVESPKGAANEARWAEVLSAAFDVFVERGYEAATVQDIASRVGLLKGSLYYYIESKEALLFAVVLRPFDSVVKYLASDDGLVQGNATTRLCRFIELFIGNLSDNSTEAEHRLVQQEMHRLSAPHRREIRTRSELVESFLRDILTQGIADGDFDPETDLYVASHSIFSLLNNSWRLRRRDQPWSEIVNRYQRFMVQGLGGDLTKSAGPRSPLPSTLNRSLNFVEPATAVYG